MKLVFFVVAMFYSAGATTTVTTCSKEDLKYEYTTCDHKGGRWKVQVPIEPEKCTITNPKPPTRGKSCDFTCKPGQYLDMETEECKPCVAGTYSLGGGERFEEWDQLPPGFKVSVESLGSFFQDEEETVNCSSSLWTPRGNYISSLAQACSSSLTYSVTLVKAGTIEFEYQYPSSDTMFHFIVQNSRCQTYNGHSGSEFLEETEEGKWAKKKVHLTSGSNVLVWKTLSLLSESSTKTSRNKPILIRKVEINGVAFTSKCSKCKNGTYSSEGAAYCSVCSRNTYSLKGQATCTGCDQKSEYSERGASSCLKRPACTNKDYYEVQAPCDQNKKTRKLYKWIEPQICRTDLSGAVNLPDPSAPEDCPPCNPGMHFVEGKGCQFCPDHMYSDGAKSCQDCPASTSPNIALEYKWWNQMPENMTSNCITFSDFQFQLSCGGNCELIFLSDEFGTNGIVKSWTGEQKKQQYRHEIKDTQPLTLTWAFQSSEVWDGKEDVARIYSVKVTNTLTGGAKDCQKCMRGVKDNQCISCPAGHYVDLNNTQCLPCPANAVIRTRLAWGEDSCVKCGPGLRAKDGTSCISDCVYTDEANRKYDFTALNRPQFVRGAQLFTGSGTGYFHGFNISLCAAENTKAFCQNNMTSVIEKSDKPVHSMVCRSAMVPTKDNKIVSTQPVSIADYLTKILSNQSHESDLHHLYTQGGLPTEGMERDVHFFYKTDEKTQACPKGRETIVSLKCDQQKKGQGEIEIPSKCPDGTCDGCQFHFLWRTDQACPPCVEEDIQVIVGECLDEVQTVHYSAPKYCRPDRNMKSKEQRKCRLKLAALPFVLKVGIPSAVGVGILLFLCVIYCWCRNRKLEYKYMKLVEGSGPNYDGELPGVDSCALEDGEDEHFDTVSFSETKKKGLFSKLRGKKYKSHDDNPFETSHTEKLPLT
ncbi:endosome/lysosome-associated apoptosis and autophagy regulator family member 2-like [Saccostrea cucullata]|uniref:endosome/lysosome-associated apoptosis and autophagy regulator family member 2-like n=1 Tax=Saccostrea cuccullata TaxID=36930 RepID=UPI002ED020B4